MQIAVVPDGARARQTTLEVEPEQGGEGSESRSAFEQVRIGGAHFAQPIHKAASKRVRLRDAMAAPEFEILTDQ